MAASAFPPTGARHRGGAPRRTWLGLVAPSRGIIQNPHLLLSPGRELPSSHAANFGNFPFRTVHCNAASGQAGQRGDEGPARAHVQWPEGPQCACPVRHSSSSSSSTAPTHQAGFLATQRTERPYQLCSPSCSPYPLSRPSGPSCSVFTCSRCSHKNIVQLPRHRHSERLECRRARSRAPHHRRRMARSETRTTAQISRSSRAAGQAIQKGGAEEGRDESQWRVAVDVSS